MNWKNPRDRSRGLLQFATVARSNIIPSIGTTAPSVGYCNVWRLLFRCDQIYMFLGRVVTSIFDVVMLHYARHSSFVSNE